MRKIFLFPVCVALAFFGCGGDYGDLPPLGEHYDTYGSCRGDYRNGSGTYSGGCYDNVLQYQCSGNFVPNGTCYSSSSRPSSSSSIVSSYTPANYSNPYRTVNINGQVWLAENLNYEVTGSKCYNNDPSNCEKYGRLYDWATMMGFDSRCNSNNCSSLIQSKHQGICPNGWHLPTQAEWNTLTSFIQTDKGCSSCDAKHLKSTSGWNSNGNGLDSYRFAALPGGYGSSGGNFGDVGTRGYWWSASENNARNAYYRFMYYYYENASWDSNYKANLFSVRCVQD